MKMELSREEYWEIEKLVNCAVSAFKKADAAQSIRRLETIVNCGGYGGYTNIVLHDLVCSVKSASGNRADKDRLVSIVNEDLVKLSMRIEDRDGETYED